MPRMAQIRVRTTALLLTLQHSIISLNKGIRDEMANIISQDPRRTVGLLTAGFTLTYGVSLLEAAPRPGVLYPAWIFLNGLFFPGAWAVMLIMDALVKISSIIHRWKSGEIWTYLLSGWMWWSMASSFFVTGLLMPGLGLYVALALTNSLLVVWTCTDTQHAARKYDSDFGSFRSDSHGDYGVHRATVRIVDTPHRRETSADLQRGFREAEIAGRIVARTHDADGL